MSLVSVIACFTDIHPHSSRQNDYYRVTATAGISLWASGDNLRKTLSVIAREMSKARHPALPDYRKVSHFDVLEALTDKEICNQFGLHFHIWRVEKIESDIVFRNGDQLTH